MTSEETQKLNQFLINKQNGFKEPIYRLYYGADGTVLFYTIDDLPGQWVSVSKQEYIEARTDLTVVSGKIVAQRQTKILNRLVKNLVEGVQTSKYDINIITDIDPVYWKNEQYQPS